ncbi:MAG: hypothetical protein LBC86_06475 [Oscillospiraceae bacterium]|nr:hypothetical protein [Oscillospiraceae bacterium]
MKKAIALLLAGVMLLSACGSGETELAEQETDDPIPVAVPENSIEVDLWGRGLTNEEFAGMIESGEIPQNVTRLFLVGNKVSDFSLLRGFPDLVHLDLAGSELDDVSGLAGFTNLIYLNLESNPLTESQIEELQAALPNCRINIEITIPGGQPSLE